MNSRLLTWPHLKIKLTVKGETIQILQWCHSLFYVLSSQNGSELPLKSALSSLGGIRPLTAVTNLDWMKPHQSVSSVDTATAFHLHTSNYIPEKCCRTYRGRILLQLEWCRSQHTNQKTRLNVLCLRQRVHGADELPCS